MQNTEGVGDCNGRRCKSYMFNNDLGCAGDPGSCYAACFIEAEESVFHDAALIAATEALKNIIDNIAPHPDGRKLSFVNTNMGTLLAWVTHDFEVTEETVSEDDDDATVAAALGLLNVTF